MACEYCKPDPSANLLDETNSGVDLIVYLEPEYHELRLEVYDTRAQMDVGAANWFGSWQYPKRINFCPMCGRRLVG